MAMLPITLPSEYIITTQVAQGAYDNYLMNHLQQETKLTFTYPAMNPDYYTHAEDSKSAKKTSPQEASHAQKNTEAS